MIRPFAVLVTLFMLAFCVLAGCGDGGVIEPGGEGRSDVPRIPEPSFFGDQSVPEMSEELVVESCVPANFMPAVEAARFPDPGWPLEPDTMYALRGEPPFCDDSSLVRRYLLVGGDTLVTDITVGKKIFVYGELPHCETAWFRAYPLSERPVLQYVKYWVRLGEVVYHAGDMDTTVWRGVRVGMPEPRAETFARTLGVVDPVHDSWIEDFAYTVAGEFGWPDSLAEHYYNQLSAITPFVIEAEPGRRVGFAAWTLVEEFRIVGDSGAPYTDWGYLFTEDSMAPAVHRSSTMTVAVSTYFPK